ILFLVVLSFGSVFAQVGSFGSNPLDPTNVEDEAIPILDGINADVLESVPNVTATRLKEIQTDRGILRPEFGIDDVFLVKSGSTILDLERYGAVCLQTTLGGIVRSPDGPAPPGVEARPRKIEAGDKLGATLLRVTE